MITNSTFDENGLYIKAAHETFLLGKMEGLCKFSTYSATATVGVAFTAPTMSTNSKGTPVYSSSNTAVATVNSSTGVVSIVGAGNAVISVSIPAHNEVGPASSSYSLTVEKGTPALTFASSTLSLTGAIGTTGSNALTGVPTGSTATYTSSDTSKATVNESTGVVTSVATGSSTITVSTTATSDYNAGTASYTVNVTIQ